MFWGDLSSEKESKDNKVSISTIYKVPGSNVTYVEQCF